MQLNPLEPNSLQIRTNEYMSEYFYQIEGSEISWIKVEPNGSEDFTSDVNSHRWTDLGLYSDSDSIKFNLKKSEGGFSDTMISDIYEAYTDSGIIVGSLDSKTFRTSLSPNMKITLPLDESYSGNTTGLSSIDLYTSFVSQNDSKLVDGTKPCSTWKVDSLYSESHVESTFEAGIGYYYDDLNNPGPNTNNVYKSGVVYLFSEDIQYSGTTGGEWSKGWSADTRYTFGGSPLAVFDGEERDRAVGLVNVDSGSVIIFNPEIVSSLNTSISSGGTMSSGMTFPTEDCNMVVKDIDFSTSLDINTTLTPNTFTNTMNPSLLDAKQDGIKGCGDSVSITKICYYDEFGNLVATGLLDKPLVKRQQDFTLLKSSVTLDGGEQDSPANDGRVVFD